MTGLALAALLVGCARAPSDRTRSGGPPDHHPTQPHPQAPAEAQAPAGPDEKEDQPMPEKPSPAPRPAGRGEPVVARPVDIKPDLFKTVLATDGTFSMKVPSDWTVQSATMDRLTLWSPRGEMILRFAEQVVGNQQTLQFQLLGEQGLRQQAGKAPLTREELELRARKVSPPLSPVDVVRVYWPTANAPLVQNMRVLETHDPPPEVKRFWEANGARAAIIHYQYTLKPREGSNLQREQLPPVPAGRDEMAMEGEAWVVTHLPISSFWVYQAHVAEAPAELFQKNQVLYDVIGRSKKDNPEAVKKIVNAKNAAIESMGRGFLKAGEEWQRSSTAISEYWRYVLGDQVPYYSERENRIYTISPEQQHQLGGGVVVGPGGEVLRPAAVEDIKRTLPSLVPND